MTIEDLKNHCEKQIDLCSKLNDYKHLEEHQIILNLIKENQELKQKYENAVADYETTMVEKNELKKQLEDIKQELTDEINENYKLSELWCDSREKVRNLEIQQKEFINYLENEIQNKRKKATTLTAFIRNVVPLQQILQKYKETIGVSDENNK